MLKYLIGVICICLGFLLPSIGGYEQIFLIIGGYVFFKKIREDYGR